MRQTISGLLVILLVGCVPIINLDDVRAKNASSLLKLNIGMDKQGVLQIMGTETIQTYTGDNIFDPHYYKDKKIPNPYRTEIVREDDKNFEVLYYYTDIKKQDGAITNDELTPLVFDNGKLIGWGWSFFEDTTQKYEIELRER